MFSTAGSITKFQAYLWMCYAIFFNIFAKRDTYAQFLQSEWKKILAGDI